MAGVNRLSDESLVYNGQGCISAAIMGICIAKLLLLLGVISVCEGELHRLLPLSADIRSHLDDTLPIYNSSITSDGFLAGDSERFVPPAHLSSEDSHSSPLSSSTSLSKPSSTSLSSSNKEFFHKKPVVNFRHRKNSRDYVSHTKTDEQSVCFNCTHHGTQITAPSQINHRTHVEFQDNSFGIGNEPVIYVGGLFEFAGLSNEGRDNDCYQHLMGAVDGKNRGADVRAALLAVDHVNRRRLLGKYRLKMICYNTKCDPGHGADAFYDLMYKPPTISLIVGVSCSDVAKVLGEIVPYWNLLLLSHAASSPALSDREKYPTFYRLTPTDPSHNTARLAFIKHFGWNTVATLHEHQEVYSLGINALGKDFEKANITVKMTLTFRRATREELRSRLTELKDSDARIIIGSFSQSSAAHVFCEAFRLGVHSPRYVWLLMGSYMSNWWNHTAISNCSANELEHALGGSFTVSSAADSDLPSTLLRSQKLAEFITDIKSQYGVADIQTNMLLAYDTIWTAAIIMKHELNKTETSRRKHGLPAQAHFNLDSMRETINSLEFTGVSGPVTFDGADRLGITVVRQHKGSRDIVVALMHPDNKTLEFNCRGCYAVSWKDNRIPADKYTVVRMRAKMDTSVTVIISAVSCCGIVLAAACLAFNINYRKLKLIKMSSPKLNNVAVVGCMLVYLAVILLGLNNPSSEHYYMPLCSLRAWLLAVGFSMAFGSMFVKTFRVHQLFRKAHRGLIKSKLLRDTQLLLLVGGLTVLDSGVLSVWIAVDPLHCFVHHLPRTISDSDPDILYSPEIAVCHSKRMNWWTGALYAYKGLMLLFGVYMAWETRNVQVAALNDSKYIGINIYNVVLCSVTAVTLSTQLMDNPTLSYIVVASLILLSTTLLLLFLFLPKMYAMGKKKDDLASASGFVTKASTRRFSSPEFEKREERRRAQIQNRVFKQRLYDLDQDISRLELQLTQPEAAKRRLTRSLFDSLPESVVDGPTSRKARDCTREDSALLGDKYSDSEELMYHEKHPNYLTSDESDLSDYDEEIDIRDGVIYTRRVRKKAKKPKSKKHTMIEGFLLSQATQMTSALVIGKAETMRSLLDNKGALPCYANKNKSVRFADSLNEPTAGYSVTNDTEATSVSMCGDMSQQGITHNYPNSNQPDGAQGITCTNQDGSSISLLRVPRVVIAAENRDRSIYSGDGKPRRFSCNDAANSTERTRCLSQENSPSNSEQHPSILLSRLSPDFQSDSRRRSIACDSDAGDWILHESPVASPSHVKTDNPEQSRIIEEKIALAYLQIDKLAEELSSTASSATTVL